MYKIMLSYPLFGEGMRILEETTDLFVSNSGDILPFAQQLQQADAFITRNVHPTTELLKTCPNLKIIGIPGVGYQSYDIDFLNSQGIAIVYCPNMNLRSVAEHAISMAYALTKNLAEDSAEVKKGNYAIRNRFRNFEMKGCTAGIVGFGNIGRETARMFCNNDMNIAVYDPFVPQEDVAKYGYTYCAQLNDLLRLSDIISLHMPSLPSTKNMFSKEQFDAMKDGVYLVNCARGSIVDEDALYHALVEGKVAGAGLDVMADEPFNTENPLLKLPNVVATPHVGGVTKQAAERTHEMVVRTTLQLLDGVSIDNVANPPALQHPRWSLK